MFSIHPIEVMWAQAPEDIKVNLALSLIVEILKISDGRRADTIEYYADEIYNVESTVDKSEIEIIKAEDVL